jgi:hypothetical protein
MRRTPMIAAGLLAVAVAGTVSAGAGGAERARTAARPTAARPTAARPTIVQRPIPFGAKRRAEMRAYARRHYGIDDFHLRTPRSSSSTTR